MDLAWLKATLTERGITHDEAARAAGMTQNMLTKVLNGHRNLRANEADYLRTYLGFEPVENRAGIWVVGRIGAGDILNFSSERGDGKGLYRVERPAWVPSGNFMAAEITGAASEPWALAGDLVFWENQTSEVSPEDLGRPVIAQLDDGRMLLKRLATSYEPGCWSLLSISPTQPNLFDLRLRWATRAMAPLARDAVRHLPD